MYDEYLCSQRQFRVSFDSSMVYVPYLVFYFHTFEGQNKILSFANQTGVPALSQPLKNFKKIRLCLPSLQEQRRIASIVETLNDKIENNIKINRNSHRPNISSVISGYKQPSKSAQSIEITGFIEKSKPSQIIFLYTLLPLTA